MDEPAFRACCDLDFPAMSVDDFNDTLKQKIRHNAVFLMTRFARTMNVDPCILYIAMHYFDQVNSAVNIVQAFGRHDVYYGCASVAVCCFHLAGKIISNSFTFEYLLENNPNLGINQFEVLKDEDTIIRTLDNGVLSVTALCFVPYFVSLLADAELVGNDCDVNHIIFLSKGDIRFTQFNPSVIAATAVAISSRNYYVCFRRITEGTRILLDQNVLANCAQLMSNIGGRRFNLLWRSCEINVEETSHAIAPTALSGASMEFLDETFRLMQRRRSQIQALDNIIMNWMMDVIDKDRAIDPPQLPPVVYSGCTYCVKGWSRIGMWLRSDNRVARMILIVPELASYLYLFVWMHYTGRDHDAIVATWVVVVILLVKIGISFVIACFFRGDAPLFERPFALWIEACAHIVMFGLTLVTNLIEYPYYYVVWYVAASLFFTHSLLLRVVDDVGFFMFFYRAASSTAVKASPAASVTCGSSVESTSHRVLAFIQVSRIAVPAMMLLLGLLFIWLRKRPALRHHRSESSFFFKLKDVLTNPTYFCI